MLLSVHHCWTFLPRCDIGYLELPLRALLLTLVALQLLADADGEVVYRSIMALGNLVS